MAQDAISSAELDADLPRQEVTFEEALHQLDRRMMAMERRIYLLIAAATGLIIGVMQIGS